MKTYRRKAGSDIVTVTEATEVSEQVGEGRTLIETRTTRPMDMLAGGMALTVLSDHMGDAPGEWVTIRSLSRSFGHHSGIDYALAFTLTSEDIEAILPLLEETTS